MLAILALSVVPASLRPTTSVPHDVEHFAIFFLAGLALTLGYRRGHLIQAAAVIAYAGTIECLQLWVPGRHARLSDFLVDAVAITLSPLIASLIAKLWRRERAMGAEQP